MSDVASEEVMGAALLKAKKQWEIPKESPF
jgi:hypothetical protein